MLNVMLLGLWLIPGARAVPDACDAAFGSLAEPALVSASDVRMVGLGRNDHLGWSMATLDFDGDGALDLAIGAPGDGLNGDRAGAVYLYLGPLQSTGVWVRDDADMVLMGPGPGKNAGWSVANAGDVDVDGRDDLLVGSSPATGAGFAWLYLGESGAERLVDLGTQAFATFTGTAPGDRFGQAIGGAGDVNGDGYADLVIGASMATTAGTGSGGAFVFFGPVFGARSAASAERILLAEGPDDRAGAAVGSPGDVNGDGFSDLLIGAPQESTGGANAGAAYLISGGPALGTTSLADADLILRGSGSGRLGSSGAPAGDVDGDGLEDFWVGATQQYASKRGAIYLIAGADMSGGTQSVSSAAIAEVRGVNANDLLGSSITGGHDFDADGQPDVLVGGERADGTLLSTGAAWVVHGPLIGLYTVTTTSGHLAGAAEGAFTGAAVAAGDLNHDGFDDAIVGSPYASTTLSKVGVASIFLGGSDRVDLATWYRDSDGDTWGDASSTEACTAPLGHVGRTGDCDDGDADFHPYAIESACADIVDYNCDGSVGATDADDDGTTSCGGDCDDTDDDVGPDVDERCGDGIDNDCDGLADDGSAVDALMWYPDLDGDGFGGGAMSVPGCSAPTLFLQPPITVGGDCDDADAAVNPGTAEVCDAVDNDCDDLVDEADAEGTIPVYPDADADGHGDLYGAALACSPAVGWVTDGADCDDADRGVHPGAVEVCDHVDNDCDGRFYRGGPLSLGEAEINLTGPEASALGHAVAIMPSPFHMGAASLVVGAPRDSSVVQDAGAVYLVDARVAGMGPLAVGAELIGARHPTHLRIRGNRTRAHTGSSVAGGDIDGDGLGDVVVAAENLTHGEVGEGGFYLFYGPTLGAAPGGDLSVAQADGAWEGGVGDAHLGVVVQVFDLDGDGFDDIVATAPSHAGGGIYRGRVYVIYGGAAIPSGAIGVAASAWIDGVTDGTMLGQALAHGDFNGDGFVDLAIGGPNASADTGAVLVFHGTGARWSGAITASASTLSSTQLAARTGRALSAGDVDGDGFDDLVVGAARNRMWVVRGAAAGLPTDRVEEVADVQVSSRQLGFGATLPPELSDVNGDGRADVVFGSPDADDGGTDAGAAYVLYGAALLPSLVIIEDLESHGRIPVGTFPTWSATNLGVSEGAALQGTAPGGAAGSAVASGDLNGDGVADIAVGAPAMFGGDGQVWTMLAGGYGLDVPSLADAFGGALVVDAYSSDWTEDVAFTTGGATPAAITWDATHLYVGVRHSDVQFGGAQQYLVMYLGDREPGGTTQGRTFNTQQPGLPFAADHVLVWRADDFEMSLDAWDGSGWVSQGFTSAGVGHQEHNRRETVEFAIPWTALGDPGSFDMVGWWLHQGAGAEKSRAALPAGAFLEESYDPDPTRWFSFDRSLGVVPSGYVAAPDGGIPSLADTATGWWPDVDEDGQGDMNAPTRWDCEMHVPISFADPLNPAWSGILDPAEVLDCDDTNPGICSGAPEVLDDGVDQDCDGYDDSAFNERPVATACVLTPSGPMTDDPLVASAEGTDADGHPITWTWTWKVDGVIDPTVTGSTYPAENTERDDLISVTCRPADPIGPGLALASEPVVVVNTPPVTTSCELTPALPYTADDLSVVSAGTDADGDAVTFSYVWSRDGVVQPTWTGSTVPASATTQLETWAVACMPSDEAEGGAGLSSASVTILNHLPEVVVGTPGPTTETSSLTCAVLSATDADGDPMTTRYAWTVNGVASVTTPTINGDSYDRDDTVVCQVFVSDGFGEGTATFGPTVVLNTPPPAPTSALITPADAVDLDQLDCTVTAGAADVDGDSVGYQVEWFLDGEAWTGAVAGTWGETIDRADIVAGTWRCDVRADDGTDTSLGMVQDTQSVVHVPVEGFEKVRTGQLHSCAILDGGDDIVCWGNNDSYELGRGALSTSTDIGDQAGEMGDALVEIDLTAGVDDEEDDSKFLHLTTALAHSCALQRVEDSSPGRTGLQVRCWGGNAYGQMGLGHTSPSVDSGPVDFGTGVRPIFVEAGQESACVMLSNGGLKCWGRNDSGNLGLGDTRKRGNQDGEMGDALPFVNLGTGRTAIDVTLGRDHTCAVLDDGTVKCWGDGFLGQLGLGFGADLGDQVGEMGDALPVVSLGGASVVDVDAGFSATCARFVDGRVKCWGENTGGILGLGDTNHRGDQSGEMGASLPYVDMGTGRTADTIEVGSAHVCAVLDNDTMKCWGTGGDGRLGKGDFQSRGDQAGEMGDLLTPVVLPGGAVPVQVDAGWKTSCAITACGKVHCWGDGIAGRLGLGTTADQTTPATAINLGTNRYLDAEITGTCAWAHTITVDGDASDWLAAERFATTAGGATETMVTWDDTYIYLGAKNASVSTGGDQHWFVAYFGNNTVAGHRDGIDFGSQAPYLAAPSQTAARWRADDGFDSALDAVTVGGSNYWSGTSWYFSTGVASAMLVENHTTDVMELRIRRDELYLTDRLLVQACWVFEGVGAETSFAGTPSTLFTDGAHDPDLASYLRFELDHPSGPGAAEVRAALP